MIVTYRPDGGEQRRWEYKAEDLASAEAEDLEDAADVTFDQWQQKLAEGGMKARRALLWVLLRRDQPDLKFRDVGFRVGELEVEWDVAELRKVRAEVERSPELTDAERAPVLRLIDEAIAADEGGDPKDSTTPDPSGPAD